MAWPGVLSSPLTGPGLECPTPELREMFWVEGVAASQPTNRIILTGLNPRIRTDPDEHGTAKVSAVVDVDGKPGLQAEIILEEVWDVVLLDSFEADICLGYSPNDPYSENTPFFLGGSGSGKLHLLTRGNEDDGNPIMAFLRPNPIAPGGLTASCLFRNLYLTVESYTGGWIKVTPVVNGEVLTNEAAVFAVPYTMDGRTLRRFEIPLTRGYDDGSGVVSRAGLVGTWFTCEIEAIDSWACGRLEIVEVEVQGEVLAYERMGLAFTGETMPDPARSPSVTFFLAGKGGVLSRGGQGTQDKGVDYGLDFKTNDVAPAGAGGECMFSEVHLAVTRQNTKEWTLTVIPIVDGVELEEIEITYPASPEGKMVTEHQTLSLAQGFIVDGVEVSKYHPRGAWFALAFKSDDVPNGTFTFEAVPLEGEIVRESLKDVFNG